LNVIVIAQKKIVKLVVIPVGAYDTFDSLPFSPIALQSWWLQRSCILTKDFLIFFFYYYYYWAASFVDYNHSFLNPY